MPVPAGSNWHDYVFPAALRGNLDWVHNFGKPRRAYVLGVKSACVPHRNVLRAKALHQQLPAGFKANPRDHLPVTSWRQPFIPDGQPDADPCELWGAYGKDQPEHAWARRSVMTANAIKTVAAMHTLGAPPGAPAIAPSVDGIAHQPGQLSIHIAIFDVPGFSEDYYNQHLAANLTRLAALFQAAGLVPQLPGYAPRVSPLFPPLTVVPGYAPTFLEMAGGLSATHRTCEALVSFAATNGLPPLGAPIISNGPRGRKRNERGEIKKVTRVGDLRSYSQDCAVEIFL